MQEKGRRYEAKVMKGTNVIHQTFIVRDAEVEAQRNKANQEEMSHSVLVTYGYDGTMPNEVHGNKMVPSLPLVREPQCTHPEEKRRLNKPEAPYSSPRG